MAFRVRTSPKSKRDAREILSWLHAEHAGETGLRWFEGLQIAILSLQDMPERCPLAPENPSVPFEMRQLLYGSRRHRYRILFTIRAEEVIILHIRRPGQQSLTSH
jgi:plasmid stabilization system protein ParE